MTDPDWRLVLIFAVWCWLCIGSPDVLDAITWNLMGASEECVTMAGR